MRRAALMAVVLVMALSGVAQAGGPVDKVQGRYTYAIGGDEGNQRLVSVNAQGTTRVTGTWSREQLVPDGSSARGSVSCLVVDGPDAWVAGPVTRGTEPLGVAAFLWVHDGGLPHGEGDMATTWIADLGVQTLADMEALCQAKATTADFTGIMAGLVQNTVLSGNLTVRSAH